MELHEDGESEGEAVGELHGVAVGVGELHGEGELHRVEYSHKQRELQGETEISTVIC